MAIGLVGILPVIVLQLLLLMGVLPFQRQIGMVSIAFLVATVWFILNAWLGRQSDTYPKGMILNVLAGLYFGYPVWAWSLYRRTRN